MIWINPARTNQSLSGTCHAVGGFALNLCYLFSSVFIVQVLKSCEPVATLTLGTIILNEKPSVALIMSVLTIISGVAMVCFRDSTVSLAPVLIAMFSNFVLPMRNVLSKKIMITNADAMSAVDTQAARSTLALNESAEERPLLTHKDSESLAVGIKSSLSHCSCSSHS